MIESCSKKRMLLGIVCLGGLTVIVLVVESHWTEHNNNSNNNNNNNNNNNDNNNNNNNNNNSNSNNSNNNYYKNVDNSSKAEHHCWQTESFEVIEPCHPCSEFEIASKSVEACIPTHFKEGIKCHVSGKTQRSCTKVKWIEEKKYWIFEITMFVLALSSYSVVYIRQRVLDRRIMLRIQKQLANGLVS